MRRLSLDFPKNKTCINHLDKDNNMKRRCIYMTSYDQAASRTIFILLSPILIALTASSYILAGLARGDFLLPILALVL